MATCRHCKQQHGEPTPKQARFAREYLLDHVATAACVRAGYSSKSAGSLAAQLMANPKIRCLLDQLHARQADRFELDADTILQGLLDIATLDWADIIDKDGRFKPLHEWPAKYRRTVSGIEVLDMVKSRKKVGKLTKLRIPDRIRAYELLGKNLKLFTEQLNVTGTIDLKEQIAAGRRRVNGGAHD